jgi:hypothetical protein
MPRPPPGSAGPGTLIVRGFSGPRTRRCGFAADLQGLFSPLGGNGRIGGGENGAYSGHGRSGVGFDGSGRGTGRAAAGFVVLRDSQPGSVTFSGSGSWRLQGDGVTLAASGVKCDGPHCENSQMDPFEAIVRMTGPGELMLSDAHCNSETAAQNAQPEAGSGEEENRQADAQQFLEGLGQILGGIAALQNNGDDDNDNDNDNGYGNNAYGNNGYGNAPAYNPPPRQQKPYVDQTAQKAKKIASLRYVLAMYKRALHSAEQSLKVNEKSPHIGYWQMQVRQYEQKVSETEAKLAALE